MTTLDVSDFVAVEIALDPHFTGSSGAIAFRSNRAGAPQVFLLDDVGGEPRQLTRTAGVVYAIDARPRHDEVLFVTDEGGDEQFQLRLLDVHTQQVRDLRAEPQVIFNRGAWSQDGRLLSYASNRRDVSHFDIYVLDVDAGVEHCVWRQDAMLDAGCFGPDSSFLIASKPNLKVAGDSDLYRVSLSGEGQATGAPVLLTEHDAKGGHGSSWVNAVVHSSGAVLALSDEGREFAALQRIEADGSAREVVLSRDWDIEWFAVDADGSRLVIVVNEDGYSNLAVLDLDADGRPVGQAEVSVVPRGIVGCPDWSGSGDSITFTLVGDRNPSHGWIAGVGGGAASTRATQITASRTGRVNPAVLPEAELVRYPTFDSREIPGFLYRATAPTEPPSCLVLVHGGPESQSRPSLWGQPAMQKLLTEGVSVFVPNVRGSTGYGKEYSHADDVEKRMDSVRDLIAGADWLGGEAGIGAVNMGVIGQSYGGFMVLAAITEAPERWAMAVDLYGIANFETFMEFTGAWRRKHRALEYGDDPAFLRSISPIHKADAIVAPLLVVQGDRDVRVPQEESEQIVETVRRNGGIVDYVLYPDEGHGIQKIEHRLDMAERVVAFARTHVLRSEG